jgi:hypothetical protein
MKFRRALVVLFGGLALASCAPVDTAADQTPTTITLTRGVCFGTCPDYTVTIASDGEVTYVGRRFVNVVGEQHATVAAADVARLLTRFDDIGFTQLRDEYRAQVTDLPTYIIVHERNGQRKTVLDYGGVSAGMPRAVRDLQNEIDRVANTGRWVLRDGQPVRPPPER